LPYLLLEIYSVLLITLYLQVVAQEQTELMLLVAVAVVAQVDTVHLLAEHLFDYQQVHITP
jgi:hypothetical protein